MTCSIEGCDNAALRRTWCSKHYTRWVRYGSADYRIGGEIRDGKKVCSRCREDKPVDEFGEDASKPSGLNTYCRPCVVLNAAAYRLRKPHYWVTGEHRRRARMAGVAFEPIDRLAIFDRDGWACGICHDHIHRVLVYPHPMSAALDHVMPLSLGGAHEASNCQASHWICNLRKSNKVAA